jgi:hypothetical protein
MPDERSGGNDSSSEHGAHRELRMLFKVLFSDEGEDQESTEATEEHLRFKEAQISLGLAPLDGAELDSVIDGIGQAGDQAVHSQLMASKATTAATFTLTAGVVAWTLRSGALLAGLFASTPLWFQLDPLPVLGRQDEEDEESDGDGDGTDSLFGGDPGASSERAS